MSGGSLKRNDLMSRYSRHAADTEELWSYQIISKHCLVKFLSWESSSYLFVCLQCNDGYHNLFFYYGTDSAKFYLPALCQSTPVLCSRCLVWRAISSVTLLSFSIFAYIFFPLSILLVILIMLQYRHDDFSVELNNLALVAFYKHLIWRTLN